MTYRPRFLSHSSMELYVRCPAAWQRRYVYGVIDPPTPAMAFGRCFATALEALHRGQSGNAAWMDTYHAARQVGELPPGSPSMEHGLELLALYQARGVLVGEPEKRWEFRLPNQDAVPVPLMGYMDVCGPDEVAEFKTSAALWDQGRVDGSMQGQLYAWAFHRLTGRKPRCVRFLVFSTSRVAMQEFEAYPASGETLLLELRAAGVWQGIRDEKFDPQCKQRYCAACVEAGLVTPQAVVSGEELVPWEA